MITRRIRATCDRCKLKVWALNEGELGTDPREMTDEPLGFVRLVGDIDLCPSCFRDFRYGFMGVKMRDDEREFFDRLIERCQGRSIKDGE